MDILEKVHKNYLNGFFSKKIFFWSPFNLKMACHYDSGLADLSIFLDFVQSKRPGGTSKLYK